MVLASRLLISTRSTVFSILSQPTRCQGLKYTGGKPVTKNIRTHLTDFQNQALERQKKKGASEEEAGHLALSATPISTIPSCRWTPLGPSLLEYWIIGPSQQTLEVEQEHRANPPHEPFFLFPRKSKITLNSPTKMAHCSLLPDFLVHRVDPECW